MTRDQAPLAATAAATSSGLLLSRTLSRSASASTGGAASALSCEASESLCADCRLGTLATAGPPSSLYGEPSAAAEMSAELLSAAGSPPLAARVDRASGAPAASVPAAAAAAAAAGLGSFRLRTKS